MNFFSISLRFIQIFLGLIVFCGNMVWAADSSVDVNSIDIREEKGIYLLNGQFDVTLGDEVKEALNNGVSIEFSLRLHVFREHWLRNKSVARIRQRFRLQYHALSQQYLLTNLNTLAQSNYPSREEALSELSRIRDFPLIDDKVLSGGNTYLLEAKLNLDFEALPPPLRLVAYLSSNWHLRSDWYQCLITEKQ